MDKRIEEYWVGKYPKLFAGYHKTVFDTPMARGFTCGNGWFYILDQLWKELSKFPTLEIGQVKEKLGGLRVYPNSHVEGVREFINTAEIKSYETCEFCGKPGKRQSDGWIFTLCGFCAALEGNLKWAVSEQLGAEIAGKLGLRTTCVTDNDHVPDFNYTSCVVCGAIRNKLSEYKWVNPE